jgi:hypothetical protein
MDFEFGHDFEFEFVLTIEEAELEFSRMLGQSNVL